MAEFEYKLSVVVIVYNTEEYIEECLDSLVNQTLKEMEIICVNDESTDNSLNILRKYAKKYDNIKIINQKNQGGANAGNNGLKEAKGEYVTLIDSDDIVVEDAYEKLYNKAKETDSDIVGGQPLRFDGANQRTLDSAHGIWYDERTIDINKDVDIFYDVFYWDKIYRRDFVFENDIFMIPNKLYADAPLVFKAYLRANKITVIPDIVYYWRRRDEGTSITRSFYNISNMEDRLDNYYILKDYFKDNKVLFNEVIKLYLERFFYPIKGILKDSDFKNNYLSYLKDILQDIDNIYDNPYVDIQYLLYVFFILNNQIDALEEYLRYYREVKDIIVDNNKSYWNLKYFRNPDYNIPDDLFEIKKMHTNFISIGDIKVADDYLTFENIELPKTIKFNEVNINLNGLTKKDGIKKDNIYSYPCENIGDNVFSCKIPIKSLENINYYNVFLQFKYAGRDDKIRIQLNHFINGFNYEDVNKSDLAYVTFTKFNFLSFVNAYCKDLFKLSANNEKLVLKPNKDQKNYEISVHHKKNDTVYFDKINDEFELLWKYSIDENIPYELFLKVYKEEVPITIDYIKDFEDVDVDFKGNKIKIFNDKQGIIRVLLNGRSL